MSDIESPEIMTDWSELFKHWKHYALSSCNTIETMAWLCVIPCHRISDNDPSGLQVVNLISQPSSLQVIDTVPRQWVSKMVRVAQILKVLLSSCNTTETMAQSHKTSHHRYKKEAHIRNCVATSESQRVVQVLLCACTRFVSCSSLWLQPLQLIIVQW